MDRLLGGSGHNLAVRLGQPAGTPAGELRTAAMEQLATWQQVAESPLSSRSVQLAARGVIRTLEGLLVALSTPDPAASAGG